MIIFVKPKIKLTFKGEPTKTACYKHLFKKGYKFFLVMICFVLFCVCVSSSSIRKAKQRKEKEDNNNKTENSISFFKSLFTLCFTF